MADAVHLRNVVALSGRFPVLAGADLQADAGEIVLLRGANGAGKTSLLRLCAGLLAPASGQALVLGQDLVRDRRAVRSRVGFVSHASSLYDDLTVAENVTFAARAARVGTASVAPVLERCGLAGRVAGLPVRLLSAGQRRRAALAAVLVRRPELWLMDEPTAGLDAGGRELVESVVSEAAASGRAVIIATHDPLGPGSTPGRTVTVAGGRTSEALLVA